MFGTILRDPLSWGALAVSVLGAFGLVTRYPLSLVQIGMVTGLAVALMIVWIGLATVTGHYRRRRRHTSVAEARDWSDRQTRRADALRLAFERLDHEDGTDAITKLSASFGSFQRALSMRPPDSELNAKRLGVQGRDLYEQGLAELETLSVTLNTLASAGKLGDDPGAARFLQHSDHAAERLFAVAIALSDGDPGSLSEAEVGLTRPIQMPDPPQMKSERP